MVVVGRPAVVVVVRAGRPRAEDLLLQGFLHDGEPRAQRVGGARLVFLSGPWRCRFFLIRLDRARPFLPPAVRRCCPRTGLSTSNFRMIFRRTGPDRRWGSEVTDSPGRAHTILCTPGGPLYP